MSNEPASDHRAGIEPTPSPDPLPRRRSQEPRPRDTSGREAYNVVTDTLTGPNLRRRDNLLQAAFIGVCLLIAVPIGAFFGGCGGALLAVLAALIVGVIVSGAFLGIYRAVRHYRGQHD